MTFQKDSHVGYCGEINYMSKVLGLFGVCVALAGCTVHIGNHEDADNSAKGNSGSTAFSSSNVVGSGKSKEEIRNVSAFDSIELQGSGNVVIEQNGKEGVTVSGDDNIVPLITTTVKDKVLDHHLS